MTDTRIVVTRPDGRPECYDAAAEGFTANCFNCLLEGNHLLYGKGSIFMCSPVDSPTGQAEWVCHRHLPENIVIYDPATDMCRSKDGQTVWREGKTN